MIKKVLVLVAVISASVGLHAVVAPPATAAIERCSEERPLTTSVKIASCIYVNGTTGRAQARLTFETSATPNTYSVSVTIHRSGASVTENCQVNFAPASGYQPRYCHAYAANPPGTQAWRSDVDSEFGGAFSSPTIYDT